MSFVCLLRRMTLTGIFFFWNFFFCSLDFRVRHISQNNDKRAQFYELAGWSDGYRVQVDSIRTNLYSVFPLLLGLDL